MSLTSELRNPKSPLSRFLATELPDRKGFMAAFRLTRPPDSDALRPKVAEGTRIQWGTLGAAIDHRLRYAFADRGLPGVAVRHGMELTLGAVGPTAREAMSQTIADLCADLERLVAEEFTADPVRPILLNRAAEERLDRLCYAMAWFEETLRTGRLWPGTPLGEAGSDFNLDSLLAAVPDYAVNDMAAQVELAQSSLGVFRRIHASKSTYLGPTFAGSSDVGGADADFIIGGRLVEVKATTTPSRLDRVDQYQLAAYVLLDYEDRYGVDGVALYLSRFGRLYEWDLDEYFGLFGAQRTLVDLRKRCAAAITRRPAMRSRHDEAIEGATGNTIGEV